MCMLYVYDVCYMRYVCYIRVWKIYVCVSLIPLRLTTQFCDLLFIVYRSCQKTLRRTYTCVMWECMGLCVPRRVPLQIIVLLFVVVVCAIRKIDVLYLKFKTYTTNNIYLYILYTYQYLLLILLARVLTTTPPSPLRGKM